MRHRPATLRGFSLQEYVTLGTEGCAIRKIGDLMAEQKGELPVGRVKRILRRGARGPISNKLESSEQPSPNLASDAYTDQQAWDVPPIEERRTRKKRDREIKEN